MKFIEGVRYYNATEVAEYCCRSAQMVRLWDKWSDEREKEGEERFIPKSIRLGKNKARYWSEYQLTQIYHFANRKKRGVLKEYSRRQWSNKWMKQDIYDEI